MDGEQQGKNVPNEASPAKFTKGPCEALRETNPITYRMLHEAAAGMGLCDDFFAISGIDPHAAVKCNCSWDYGHEPTCDIVAAHELLTKIQAAIAKVEGREA